MSNLLNNTGQVREAGEVLKIPRLEYYNFSDGDFNTFLDDEFDGIVFNLVQNHGRQIYSSIKSELDVNTQLHSARVGAFASRFATILHEKGLGIEHHRENRILRIAGELHDIGKAGLGGIINANRTLTPHEKHIVNEHPLIGYEDILDNPFETVIAENHNNDQFKKESVIRGIGHVTTAVAMITLMHHRNLEYPTNDRLFQLSYSKKYGFDSKLLSEERLNFWRIIMAVVDVSDALLNKRDYTNARLISEGHDPLALEEDVDKIFEIVQKEVPECPYDIMEQLYFVRASDGMKSRGGVLFASVEDIINKGHIKIKKPHFLKKTAELATST